MCCWGFEKEISQITEEPCFYRPFLLEGRMSDAQILEVSVEFRHCRALDAQAMELNLARNFDSPKGRLQAR